MLLLSEHAQSEPVSLTHLQQQQLRLHFDAVIIFAPEGKVVVTPGAKVGAATFHDLEVVVKPKLPIAQLLTLVMEIADPYRWLNQDVKALTQEDLHDALIALFAQSCIRTFERGLLQSYRKEKQELGYVRGRIRLSEYLTTPMPLPIPVTAGVFDGNNPENQILKTVLSRFRNLGQLSDETRSLVHIAWRSVEHVSLLRSPLETFRTLRWNRQNDYYKPALTLAEILLRDSGGILGSSPDNIGITGFVLDLPTVIEQWVRTRLRLHWNVNDNEMRDSWKYQLWLDRSHTVQLIPDLALRTEGTWKFVGDVKYKNLDSSGALHEDIYQLLAYLTATGLTEGTLIYAGVNSRDHSLLIEQTKQRLHIVSIDLNRTNPGLQLEAKFPHP